MGKIFFLVLRRMRLPLIVLVSVYSIATLGMTLIPGVTPESEAWHMSFFHAFYFVSFMGTTIGFGEIPYEFTDAQRSWVLVCIYTSVVSWLYGIGSLLRLVQDETFLHAVAQRNFQRAIMRIDAPFYLICGYGETGEMITRGLCSLGLQTVVIDRDKERITGLELDDYISPPIALVADMTDPSNLIRAGIKHEQCRGVLAVSNNDHTNLQVAVASKLVNTAVKVITRSEIEDEAKNMASFGTDTIINPYLTFAQRLRLLATLPKLYKLHSWFINQYSSERLDTTDEQQGLPTKHWIICGYGRFGKAVHTALEEHVDKITIVTQDPIASRAPDGTVVGRGTEAETLLEAGIENADVIVAANDDDANNLSIVMTAQQLKNDIVTVARSSKEANKTLFLHAQCHYIMRRSLVVANEALTSISRPLVTKFIHYSDSLSSVQIDDLIQGIEALVENRQPVTWRLRIDENNSPELVNFIRSGQAVTVGKICDHPKVSNGKCIPLLLFRNGVSDVMPDNNKELRVGDQLLVCGPENVSLLPQMLQNNIELLDSLLGHKMRYIPLLRWWSRRKVFIKK